MGYSPWRGKELGSTEQLKRTRKCHFGRPAFSFIESYKFYSCHYLILTYNLRIWIIFINALWQGLCALDLKSDMRWYVNFI